MRKDVKLGFAIGGVLLAVLIVYVLVVPGGGDKRLASSTGGDGNSQATKTDRGGGVSLEPVTPQPATQPSHATGSAVAGGPPAAPPQSFTPPTGGTDPFEQPDASANANSKTKDVDWSKLLNDSQMLMVTPNKTAAGAGGAATPSSSSSHTAKSDTVQTALVGTPDITKPGPTPIVPPPAQAKSSPSTPVAEPADAKPATPVTPPPTVDPAPVTPSNTETVTAPAADHTGAASNTTTTTTDANGQKIHVVASGETFSTISLSAYGNPNLYAAIMRANPGVEPTKLRPGMKIVIPPAPEAKPAAAPVVPSAPSRATVSSDSAQTSASRADAPIDPQTQYRVQPGDSLYSIAKKLYGRGDRFTKIHEANRQLLGDDVNSVKSGQILTLPEPPTNKQQ